MMATLRSLERRLVRERAEVGVNVFVDDLIGAWEGGGPDAHAAIACAELHPPASLGFLFPVWHRTANYLAGCRIKGARPRRGRLTRLLLLEASMGTASGE